MKGLLYIRSVSLVALFLCGYISSYDLSLVSHSPSATCVLQEHPGFEKNRKSEKTHIPQRARDLFSNRHFAENRNELNR
jgi:hypothetical protein